jgi:hypothetical protein
MSVVRVSLLNVPSDQFDRVAGMMKEAEEALSGIRKLKGLKAYFAGIDREKLQLSNVSIWESEADALQMATFQPMADLAKLFLEVPGLGFVRPIPNFETIWQWGDVNGGLQE